MLYCQWYLRKSFPSFLSISPTSSLLPIFASLFPDFVGPALSPGVPLPLESFNIRCLELMNHPLRAFKDDFAARLDIANKTNGYI
ncbi:uncharacterized protein TERG_03621 [Trichophyton rubrum CBS 118892]|uniref:Uncharacterized protein n=1 Tax=Trichophyton rubrum (strain ATCC MYA-4607 / CBS 118892) TaxID=559305 RepID=F2SL41_TRIRC|nr:uncharacterized protein TERG_03621 [Trichophyton rubrum CBS 118892]EGD87373.2 hypothetical protein TERG_03621 [Trichophyton rubrum CBS 118892]